MKIRQGFVTNSSSSSFILVIKKNDLDKVMDHVACNKSNLKKVLDYLGPKETEFLGEKVLMFSTIDTHEGSCWDYFDDAFDVEPIEGMDGCELFELFKETIKNLKVAHLTHTINM